MSHCMHGTDCPLCKKERIAAERHKAETDPAGIIAVRVKDAEQWMQFANAPCTDMQYSHSEGEYDYFLYTDENGTTDELGIPVIYYSLNERDRAALVMQVEHENNPDEEVVMEYGNLTLVP